MKFCFNNKQLHDLVSIDSNPLFGLEKFLSLKQLELHNKGITSIEPRSFVCLQNLNTLNLNTNKLTRIKVDFFKGLKQLKSLYLDGNGVVSIDPKSFDDLHSLETLVLGFNQLEKIEAHSFQGL